MRIGFLGNANNFPFMLARAIQRLGHDVEFIVSGSDVLDRPENRYPDIRLPYPVWLHDIRFTRFDWIAPTRRRANAVKILNSCDAVILNQLGPTLLPLLRKPGLVLLTGTDLHQYSNPRTAKAIAAKDRGSFVNLFRKAIEIAAASLVARQRRGIAISVAVNYFSRGVFPDGDALLDEIGVQDDRRMFFMMSDIEALHPFPIPNHLPVRVFCGTRLNWVRPIPSGRCELDYKGADVMIKGLAHFYRETQVRLDIRLVRKGDHVQETVRLIDELGIADQVTWSDVMSQERFADECRAADIVFDQLGASALGMAGLDAMALARPVIANGRPEVLAPYFGYETPICQAATPDEVAFQLKRLVFNPLERESVGKASRKYVEEYFSTERAARLCLERLSSI